MPQTVYTQAEIDAMLTPLIADVAAHSLRLAAIERRLDGTPNPPPDPPPPPPPPGNFAVNGDMDLGDVTADSLFDFNPDVSATVRVRSFALTPTGTLLMRPNSGVKHEIVIKDEAGGGQVLLSGTVDICGQYKTPYIRLSAAPLSGDSSLMLSAEPIGWQTGDRIALPDTRQLREGERWGNYVSQTERATIQSIFGNVVTLTAPLKFDHLGRDEFMPHVANLTRNVVIRSENSAGNRGWVKLTGDKPVSIANAQFGGLGRSQDMNDERFPVTRADHSGWFVMGNSSVFCPLDPMPFVWGVANVRSNSGTFVDNVAFNWKGAGFANRDGTNNDFVDNIAIGIRGDHNPTWLDGQDASGFWSNDYRNCWDGNVAAGIHNAFQGLVSGMGFNINRPSAGQWSRDQLMMFEDNEAYGCATGASFWYLGTDGIGVDPAFPVSTVKNLRAWNCWSEAFWAYPISTVVFDGITVRAGPESGVLVFSSGDYMAYRVSVRNVDAKGVAMIAGWFMQTPGWIEFIGGKAQCTQAGFVIWNQGTPGMQFANKWPREVRISGIAIDAPKKLVTEWREHAAGMDYVVSDIITIDGQRVYYQSQKPDAIVPQTTYDSGRVSNNGCPESGLRNDQALERHGVCNAGAIAPAGAVFEV